MIISYCSANDIAEQTGYHMTKGWMQGHESLEAWFCPEETFAERFDAYIKRVRTLGFEAVDLYTAHLGATWASDQQIASAAAILKNNAMTVASLAGYFGDDVDTFKQHCRMAKLLGVNLLSGGTSLLHTETSAMQEILDEHDVIFASENHPEKSIQEHLDKVDTYPTNSFGLACDTGWYATQGVDPVEAITALHDRIFHIHLKDIKPPQKKEPAVSMADMGHETCAYGDGIVDIPGCVKAALAIGYDGPWMVEHEPEDEDPGSACTKSKAMLESLLSPIKTN